MPDVEDEHDAQLVALVPGLMLDGVVEYPRLARNPLPGIVADPEITILGDDQGQMRNHAHVADADVRRNGGPRTQQREHRRGRASRLVGLRHVFQRRHRLWASQRIGIDSLPQLEQVKCVPARRIVELRKLIDRNARRIRNVGRKSLLGAEHVEEFVPDVIGRLFDPIDPRKLGAVEELDRRKIGEMVIIDCESKRFLRPTRMSTDVRKRRRSSPANVWILLIEIVVEELALVAVVLLHIGHRLGDRRAQFGPQPLHRRSNRCNRAVGNARLVHVSFALEGIGAKDQGHELAGDRSASALSIASSAALSSLRLRHATARWIHCWATVPSASTMRRNAARASGMSPRWNARWASALKACTWVG